MRYTQLFGKTSKTAPQDADSINARLLVQAGFIDQLMAGVYTYLPLGLRSLDKIKDIVRDEMDGLGAQELLMPALSPKELWLKTERWEEDVMYHVPAHGDREFGLGWTHEEVVTPLVKKRVNSYKDLPLSVYQIQDKFRKEKRAKSGLLRGREFSMKDLYSFHANNEDRAEFYDKVADAYRNIFKRCGLDALYVEASGGSFSEFSHEFQVLTESGEDIVFHCDACGYAQNKEITQAKGGESCVKCKEGTVQEGKAIEVGNIFDLQTKYTAPFDMKYTDEEGKENPVIMGCYGLGPSRVMGAIVEVHNDDKGMKWPVEVAPFHVHLIAHANKKDEEGTNKVMQVAQVLEKNLEDEGIEVLFDDRVHTGAGQKFGDADLIGLPIRVLVSQKSLEENSVEWKLRVEDEAKLIPLDDVLASINAELWHEKQ